MSKGNKRVVLTGASRGIGHATVKRFSDEGWRIITCSREEVPEACKRDPNWTQHIPTVLRITDEGRDAFKILMASNVRAPVNDVTRLIVALKLRFMPLLSDDERADQLDALAEMCEQELVRLRDLQGAYGDSLLGRWLNDEVEALVARHAMFSSLQNAS